MIKRAVIQKIMETLQSELETYTRAAKTSHAEATAEEYRAENKYDTRGLEASYLAAGQASKVVELEESITEFQELLGRNFTNNEGIDVGALIEIKQDGKRAHYFIGPSAGGTEIEIGETEVLVITPQSPLGSQLKGRRENERFNLTLAGESQQIHLINVS